MKRDELSRELQKMQVTDRAKLDELAHKLGEEARGTVQEAVKIWIGTDAVMSRKAAYVLTRIEDLAIVPLLDAKARKGPLHCSWRMERIVTAQLEVRKKIVALLQRMLDDKTIVPYPEGPGPIEEPSPDVRICDEAYIQMRQLIHFGESPDDHLLNASIYDQMDFGDRDRVINKYRQSQTWTDLLEESFSFEDEEEEKP